MTDVTSKMTTYQLRTHGVTTSQRQSVGDRSLPLHPLAKTVRVLRQTPRIDHTIESAGPSADVDDDFVTVAVHSHVGVGDLGRGSTFIVN